MNRDDDAGRLEQIWIKRAKQGPMDPKDHAELIAGRGLVGNADQGGHRQVTLIEQEKWEQVSRELGASVDPTLRRANLMVRGVELNDSFDRVLRIGDCRVRLRGRTRPCRLMEESHTGLQAALEPDWRCGAYGEVLDDGEIRIGDEIRWDA